MAEPLTGWPAESWTEFLARINGEMNFIRMRAMARSAFHLERGNSEKALKILRAGSKECRDMYEEVEDRRMIEAARVAGATWEEVYVVLSGWGRIPVAP